LVSWSRRYRPLGERLSEKYVEDVDTGCWIYQGAISKNGYGWIGDEAPSRKTIGAHRAAYKAWVGPIPEGYVVLHSCDNPPCINPEHLRTGTQKENMHEMDAKGRRVSLRGPDSPRAKLSRDDVEDIKWLYGLGAVQTVIAAAYGVVPSHVSRIVRGKDRRYG
jgi:hypothetical protein